MRPSPHFALVCCLVLGSACEPVEPPRAPLETSASAASAPASNAPAPLSVTLTRTPTSFVLEGSGPVALPAEARKRVLEAPRLTRVVLQLESRGALDDKGALGLGKVMEAGLALDNGVITVAKGRILVEGTVRNQADREVLEANLAESVVPLGLEGSTLDFEIDSTSLREDEGFIKRVGGAPFVGTLEPLSGGPAVEVDSEGRAPFGVYRVGSDGQHLAVAAGKTTWVRDGAPSILIGGKRFALDTEVKVVLPGEVGALGFVTEVNEDGSFASYAVGKKGMPLSGPRYQKPGDKLLIPELFEDRDFIHHVLLHADTVEDSAAGFEALVKEDRSTHFLIDWDGTIYQMLDVANCAYHAGEMNMRSIGIDLNNLLPNLERNSNASPWPKKHPRLAEMMAAEHQRPVSKRLEINGAKVKSYGYTEAQYRALGSLLRTLAVVFPAIDAGPPLRNDGEVVSRIVADPLATPGVLAHWHVEADRWDPGPGLDWKKLGLGEAPAR